MKYIRQSDEIEAENLEQMKQLINFEDLKTVVDMYECPEGCSECCDSMGIVQIYTRKKFEAFKNVVDGINVDTKQDMIQIGEGTNAFNTDVYGIVTPCTLTSSTGRCNLDDEYLPLDCQIRPFSVDNNYVNGSVMLHICDKGMQIYEDMIELIKFQNVQRCASNDYVDKQIKDIRAEYERTKGTGKHVIVQMRAEIFTAMLLYNSIKDEVQSMMED